LKLNHGDKEKISFIHGRIDAQIEGFAESMAIPKQLLAQRLAELLYPEGMGAGNRMSQMRLATKERNSSTQKVEAPSRPLRGQTSGAGIAAYWAKMTPEQRASEVKRRMKKALRKKKSE
jgi:hypothetical protein